MIKQKLETQEGSMFDILLNLPLFAGVSRTKFSEIVGNTKFHFLKYMPGESMIKAGDVCTHVKFIISGAACISIANTNNRFIVNQTLQAPAVILPGIPVRPQYKISMLCHCNHSDRNHADCQK